MNQVMKFFLCLSLFVQASYGCCQNFKSINKKANEYFLIKEYELALPLLLKLDSISPGSAELNYKIGYCYLTFSNKSKALPYLENAKRNGFNASGLDFNLGIAYHSTLQLDKALHAFETAKLHFKKEGANDDKKIQEIERYIHMCKTGIELMSHPLKVNIQNLGKNINSPCPEYAPVISGDESTLIFTGRRPCKLKQNEMLLNEDLFISEKDSTGNWKPAMPMGSTINSSGHDASIALTSDGEKLLLYRDAGQGDIFESIRNEKQWSIPNRLPAPINSNFWEPSASISSDGKVLFFVSNRPGGLGGRDLYVCYRTNANIWTVPRNLGKNINTPFEEDAPFIHPDGKTLYFSSEGHETMGGFDIFYSIYNDADSSWSLPINIGYPINNVDDDLFYVWSADGKRGYYSSDRQGGFGDKDIFMVTRSDVHVSLLMLKGHILSESTGKPIQAKIVITDNADVNTQKICYSDALTGKFSVFLHPGINYGIAVEAENFLPNSQNLYIQEEKYAELNIEIKLKSLEKGNSLVLKNVFFELGKSVLKNESFPELHYVALFLMKNPKVCVEIGGHTDDTGNKHQNLILSKERADAVVKFLTKQGIPSQRLISKGYGEKNPISENISEAGKKLNRRTELILLEDCGGH